MSNAIRSVTFLSLWLLMWGSATAESILQPATHDAAKQPPTTISESVTFLQQPPRVGDRLAQEIGVQLDIDTSIEHSGQIAHEGQTSLQRRQRRFIELTEVAGGHARRAHVSFPVSREKSPENKNPDEEITQPVEGKNYQVTCQGEQLLITDPEGAIPPQEEYKIVLVSMQTLGQPNPLAKFLVDRTVPLGTQLVLPREIGEQLLGFDGQFGRVERFVMELRELKSIDDEPCAVFDATIEVRGNATSPVQMTAQGEVVIQTRTCRTVSAKLTGPLTMHSIERTSQGDVQYRASGRMRVTLRSRYGYANK